MRKNTCRVIKIDKEALFEFINTCRVIKIDKEALFEFIYENFIAQEENMMDINNSVDVSNNFAIDWERGEFIFAAYKDEDEAGNMIPFPQDIDIQTLLEKLPATTESALSPGKKYRDYTFDELRQIMKE